MSLPPVDKVLLWSVDDVQEQLVKVSDTSITVTKYMLTSKILVLKTHLMPEILDFSVNAIS